VQRPKSNLVDLIKRGELAYATNRGLDSNPHPSGSLAWSNWRYGWLKASRDGEGSAVREAG
jgi:hypothetical protein